MAQTFTNLSIITNNKDTAKQIFIQDQGLGNAHKQLSMDSTQSGKDASNSIASINKNQSSNGTQMQKELNLSSNELNKDQNIGKDAGKQFPIKEDLNKDKWTTETTPPPNVDVKVNTKYVGKVDVSPELPKKDSTKSEVMDDMQSELSFAQERAIMPEGDDSQYKPKNFEVSKPRDIIGEGPMVKREQPDIMMNSINQPNPTYPNVSMKDANSKPTEQAPTPTYPLNPITSNLKGLKQPKTSMPSFKLPRS